MMRDSGAFFLMTEAASMPFIDGIERTMRINPGFRSVAIAMASTPLEASPQMRICMQTSKNLRIADRTVLLSSTISTELAQFSMTLHGSAILASAQYCIYTSNGPFSSADPNEEQRK